MLPSFDVGGVRKVRRQHGFQLPLHPFQLSAWFALTVLTISTFLWLIPQLPIHVQPPMIISFTCVLLAHTAAHLSVILIDPAEEELRKIVPGDIPTLDRSKHAHVIENGYCNLCAIFTTSNRTKHCSICNKCVAGFDHHCKWLNHCVGSRNYIAFLMCVSTAIAAAAFVAVLAIQLIIVHKFELTSSFLTPLAAANNKNETEIKQQQPIQHSSLPSSDATFIAFVGIIAILALIAIGLLLHLCFFHIYISFLGLTTYEYIRQQRQVQEAEKTVTITRESDKVLCSDTNFLQRPVDFHCKNRTFFSCTMVKETCSFSCPTPPCTPQTECCNICNNGQMAPEGNTINTNKKVHKIKKRWNCCTNVPDSPEEIQSQTQTKCSLSLCKHTKKKSATERTTRRTHWSTTKLRLTVLFRVLGNLRLHNRTTQKLSKTNQVAPSDSINNSESSVQTINNLIPIPIYPHVTQRANTLPPMQLQRRIIDENELTNALSLLQMQQQQQCTRRLSCLTNINRRRKRNNISTIHKIKTPALSPIRESGLSNPASPSHCAVGNDQINGASNRPYF